MQSRMSAAGTAAHRQAGTAAQRQAGTVAHCQAGPAAHCPAGPATTNELSQVLSLPPEEVRTRLRTLVTAGLAQRTGHGRGTRYHG